jgi:hypothetical protein
MNTLKASTIAQDRATSHSRGDALGLLSDMLEPSPRFVGNSEILVAAGTEASHAQDTLGSLSELRMPKSLGRIGFSEFLD